MTETRQTVQLNVLKCFLTLRRTRSEKETVYFYEILSPAGLYSSCIGITEGPEEAVTAESDIKAFIAHTKSLSKSSDSGREQGPSALLSSLKNILLEVLSPEAARGCLEKGSESVKNLEEGIRDEVASRLGYRVTAYVKVEKTNTGEIKDHLGDDFFSQNTPPGDGGEDPHEEIAFLVPCKPSIDPVRGKPAASLEAGDIIVVFLPEEESPFSERLRMADPDFNGMVSAEVISVHKDRQGVFTVLTRLSDEFHGVVTLEGNSKLRMTKSKKASPGFTGETLKEEPEGTFPLAMEGTSLTFIFFLLALGGSLLVILLLVMRNVR